MPAEAYTGSNRLSEMTMFVPGPDGDVRVHCQATGDDMYILVNKDDVGMYRRLALLVSEDGLRSRVDSMYCNTGKPPDAEVMAIDRGIHVPAFHVKSWSNVFLYFTVFKPHLWLWFAHKSTEMCKPNGKSDACGV